MGWCFGGRGVKTGQLAEWCVKLGMHGMEGIPRTAYKEVMDLGLEISLVGSHGFSQGPCDPRHTEMVIEKLKDGIEVASRIKAKRVITFTGMRYEGMDEERPPSSAWTPGRRSFPWPRRRGSLFVLSISIPEPRKER